MKKDTRSKMQRHAQSKRKTWTNAERFAAVQRNRARLETIARQERARQLLENAEQEMMTEMPSGNGPSGSTNDGVIEVVDAEFSAE